MKLLSPNWFLYVYQIAYFAFLLLIVVTVVKLLIVLFKVDRAIDEFRQYLRKQT